MRGRFIRASLPLIVGCALLSGCSRSDSHSNTSPANIGSPAAESASPEVVSPEIVSSGAAAEEKRFSPVPPRGVAIQRDSADPDWTRQLGELSTGPAYDRKETAKKFVGPRYDQTPNSFGPLESEFAPESMAAESMAAEPMAAESMVEAMPEPSAFTNVDVFYATDRAVDSASLSSFQLSGQRQLISLLGFGATASALFMVLAWFLSRPCTAKLAGGLMVLMMIGAGITVLTGRAGIEKQGVMYSGGRGELVRGVCRVSVPKTHVRGKVERPSLLKFEVYEDQEKHLVLTSVQPLESDAFTSSLQDRLRQARQPDLLVFIHGYNVGFEAAVTRTAQIAVDLPFEGIPICYSWPSQGTLLGYPIDENNAAWTVSHLKQFLDELVQRSGAKSINVVAHSMGNRAMTAAMQQMSYQSNSDEPLFDRIVLAAPDVDADLFRKDLAPSLIRIAKQVTLYASSDDQALIASKQVHGYPRAGETGDQLVVVPGVDTIDVSGIDLSLLGHSYYGDSELMLRDLFEVILSRLPAAKRSTLISRQLKSQVYWQLAGVPQVARKPK